MEIRRAKGLVSYQHWEIPADADKKPANKPLHEYNNKNKQCIRQHYQKNKSNATDVGLKLQYKHNHPI